MSLPLQFVSNIVANLISEGKLDGTLESGKFVPVSYVERRREALVQQLRAEGLIGMWCNRVFLDYVVPTNLANRSTAALEDFKRERIEDPEDFVHRQLPDAILLAQHFVTPSFIAHIEGLVLESIEKQEWSDVKVRLSIHALLLLNAWHLTCNQDPDQRLSSMDENKLRILISHSLPELQLIADRLVSNDLEGRLRSRTKQFAQKRADGAWRNRSTTPTDTTKITWAEVSPTTG